MGYERILKLSLVPTVLYFLLSLVSVILTTHYWILSDWIMGRYYTRPRIYSNPRLGTLDDMIVDYTEPSTNATITSGCLGLGAGVMAMVAYSKLKKQDMDSDFHAPLRRAYVGAVFAACTTSIAAAIAAIATHYTDKSNGEFGCTTSEMRTTAGKVNTNFLCSREMGACNFAATYQKGTSKAWSSTLACNEVVAVKWLQIVLIFNALFVMAMFGLQARSRRRTRWMRSGKEPFPSPDPR